MRTAETFSSVVSKYVFICYLFQEFHCLDSVQKYDTSDFSKLTYVYSKEPTFSREAKLFVVSSFVFAV